MNPLVFIPVMSGYLLGALYLAVLFAVKGWPMNPRLWGLLFWFAIYGFPIGLFAMAVCHAVFRGNNRFWRFFLGVPFGWVVAQGAVAAIYPSIAFNSASVGFTLAMGAGSFFFASLLRRLPCLKDEAL